MEWRVESLPAASSRISVHSAAIRPLNPAITGLENAFGTLIRVWLWSGGSVS